MTRGMPFEYGGAADAPRLDEETDALYLALKAGEPLPARQYPRGAHWLAGDLAVISERLECDHQAARLANAGVPRYPEGATGAVSYRVGYGDRRDTNPEGLGLHVVAACVTFYHENAVHSLNAAAAARLADRLESGMEASAALERTLAQCVRQPLSETALRDLERKADAWARRLEGLDHEFSGSLGSEAHREAIGRADAEMP